MRPTRTPRKQRRPNPPAADKPSGIWWRPLLLVIAGLLVYSNSWSGPFIFDDVHAVIENRQIREWWRLGALIASERESPIAGRPLVNLSLAINYALNGLDPLGYHLVNIAIHLLCALVIFGVVRRTLELPGLKAQFGRWSAHLAFAAALLWTLHPLNTEAVNYVTQRTELMMALFYLLTLYAGIRAWESGRGRRWNTLAVAACAAGMACKESMVTAPPMVVIYDAIFLFGSLRLALTSRWRLYLGLAASWAVLAAVTWSGPRVHSAGFAAGVSPWTYLLNQTVMITQYLRLTIWPRGLVLNYGWPLPLTLADVLPYALLVASLLAFTIIVLVRQPKWGFLGLWVFVTLAPASSFVPIATEVGAERRMYLPLIALMVLVVVGAKCVKRLPATAAAVLLVLCAAGLAAGTLARNREYSSPLLLAQTVVARHPTAVAHHLLGTELILAGQNEEGVRQLRLALPGAPRAYYNLGLELFKQEKTSEAIDALQAFVREQPMLLEAVSARLVLGRALAQQQQWLPAIEQYRLVLTMNPSSSQRVETQLLLAAALVEAQQLDAAIAEYLEFLKEQPRNVAALTNLGIAYIGNNQADEALAVFRRAVEADPNVGSSQRNLANALFDHRLVDEAAVHAARAVALLPNDPGAYDTLGRALAVQGKVLEARQAFLRALEIAPNHPDATADLEKLSRALAGR